MYLTFCESNEKERNEKKKLKNWICWMGGDKEIRGTKSVHTERVAVTSLFWALFFFPPCSSERGRNIEKKKSDTIQFLMRLPAARSHSRELNYIFLLSLSRSDAQHRLSCILPLICTTRRLLLLLATGAPVGRNQEKKVGTRLVYYLQDPKSFFLVNFDVPNRMSRGSSSLFYLIYFPFDW